VKKLKRILKNDKENKENKLTATYFLYVLNLLKDNQDTSKLLDLPYHRNINYSSGIILRDFSSILMRKKIIRTQSKRKEKVDLFSIFKINKFSLTEKQRNGLIVLLTVISMGTALCLFCKKIKL
ncbi:MAG: hypothetical protein DSY60_03750, partial [Persephonella sp.]